MNVRLIQGFSPADREITVLTWHPPPEADPVDASAIVRGSWLNRK